MGVKGLTAYADREWRQSFTFHIKDENEPCQALILDGLASQRIFFPDPSKLDLCEMQNLVQNFVQNFRRCGFTLAVVFDATIAPSKIVTWASRRAGELRAIRRYQSDQSSHCKPFSVLFASSYLASAFRKAGVDVYFSIGDADAVCAYLCEHLNAFGILSKDSDYFIYEVPVYLDISTLTLDDRGEIFCFGYEMEKIRPCLKLDSNGMRMMAQILGNDVIDTQSKLIKKASKLYKSKKRGKRKSKDQMKAVAWYINEYRNKLALNSMIEKFYTPRPPEDPHFRTALQICLAQDPARVFLRLAFDDLSQHPVHSMLSDFRKQVYRRLGLKQVVEFTATETRLDPVHAFRTPEKVSIDNNADVQALQEPKENPAELWKQILAISEPFLMENSDYYLQLLRAQFSDRIALRERFANHECVSVPTFAFHVRALILQIYEFLVVGFERPPIYELFDTKLFILMVGLTKEKTENTV